MSDPPPVKAPDKTPESFVILMEEPDGSQRFLRDGTAVPAKVARYSEAEAREEAEERIRVHGPKGFKYVVMDMLGATVSPDTVWLTGTDNRELGMTCPVCQAAPVLCCVDERGERRLKRCHKERYTLLIRGTKTSVELSHAELGSLCKAIDFVMKSGQLIAVLKTAEEDTALIEGFVKMRLALGRPR
jgi:hypothetical protein